MSASISVQKFGSSVLKDEADLSRAVHAVYADLRRGRRVVAIVSAIGATTDRLLDEARSSLDVSAAPDARVLARLLATGEARAAALFSLALERAGIPVALLGSDNAGIVTEGELLDAHPIGLDEELLLQELAAKPVVVLPGFVGRRVDGELTLLGRGGSDLTAVFVAGRLRAERCILFKDVDGLYEWDPSEAEAEAERPRRFARASYADALALPGGIVQHKAVATARDMGLAFEVGSLVPEAPSTQVGAGASVFEDAVAGERRSPLRVGLLGLGTVGGGVAEHLAKLAPHFEVKAVLVRDLAKHVGRGRDTACRVATNLITDDPAKFFEMPLDLVVEALGGVEPANELVARALDKRLHVVTANKALLAVFGTELAKRAKSQGVSLLSSAAVGGGVPMLETALRLGPVSKIEGVLNGTSSFVLDRLAAGDDLQAAVGAAQDLGLAEADPTLDLDGTDVAHKIELLVQAAFGACEVEWQRRAGVEAASSELFERARTRGGSVKLVARAVPVDWDPDANAGKVQRVRVDVAPMVLGASHPLAHLRGAGSGVLFEIPGEGTCVVTGEGAGRWPTAESVVGDLLELHESVCALGAIERSLGGA